MRDTDENQSLADRVEQLLSAQTAAILAEIRESQAGIRTLLAKVAGEEVTPSESLQVYDGPYVPEYGPRFWPLVLTQIAEVRDIDASRAHVVTKPTGGKWKNIPLQQGELPRAWVRYCLSSTNIVPFGVLPIGYLQCIVPLNVNGQLASSAEAEQEGFWAQLNAHWRESTAGERYHKSLIAHIGVAGRLRQLVEWAAVRQPCVVVTNTGDLQAAYTTAMVCNDSVGVFPVNSAMEGHYLVAMLNAPRTVANRPRWRGAATYWGDIVLPRFDQSNPAHQRLSGIGAELSKRIGSLMESVQPPDEALQSAEKLIEPALQTEMDGLVAQIAGLSGATPHRATKRAARSATALPRSRKKRTGAEVKRGRNKLPATVLSRIWERQGKKCNGCQKSTSLYHLSADHIVPLATGGADEETNIQLLCTRCNSKKGIRSQDEFIARLRLEGLRDD